ncbi:MAG: hypothetical protein IPL38_04340 [Rhodobacter sp.]|nr:hypothetical protein [Rhodobacter sp.]
MSAEQDPVDPPDLPPEVAEVSVEPPMEPAEEPSSPARSRGRGRSIATVLGLAVVAATGFGFAWFDPMQLRGENPIPALQTGIADLDARQAGDDAALKALSGRIDGAEAALETQAEATDRLADLATRLKAVETTLAALSTAPANADGSIPAASFAALVAEVDALKAAPATGDETKLRALVDQAMRDWTADQAAEAEAAAADARAKAARIEALGRIKAAALSGAPYAESLAALDGLAVPDILRQFADTGMQTPGALAEAFTPAARDALDAARRASGSDGVTGGFWNFLRIQTGARSLEPREGDDPDAILSRAEAAVRAGDILAALDELAALPAEGQSAMEIWMAKAKDYLAAEQALAALAASVEE